MVNSFDFYGITRELLGPDYDYEHLYLNDRKSTIENITNAVKHLVPLNSGYELLRIGDDGDGGYLIPDDLEGVEACFSPGVNNFKDFEDFLTTAHGIKAFMCDYTSDADKLRTPLISGMQFFEKKWLDVIPGDNNTDINSWVAFNSVSRSDLILQMDIEGAEYRNLIHASIATLKRFRIIVLELHGLSALESVRFIDGIFAPSIGKIKSFFTCVHAHANNCCGNTKFSKELI